ncbi:hypothetical protein LTR64_004813 [Lithohypha guttulata]|uniref:uncharacterized protein n=1 Tax=Lithohypha guttulata TaxID=1690604 RepID=UPI002DE0DA6B|nr:hypothetical protein LTR51_005353 [Lithohypha guttulata]
MKWGLAERYTLLLKLCELNPSILTAKPDQIEKIRETWPLGDTPTSRMIPYQFTEIRKEIRNGCVIKPGTNTSTVPSSGSTPATPNTPATPKPKTGSNANTPSSLKRAATTAPSSTPSKRPKTTPGGKKRKLPRNSDDEETMASNITSEDEAEASNADTDTEVAADIPLVSRFNTIERRKLPARSKSRSKSYVQEAGSSGEDAGAKDMDSDLDGLFDPDQAKRDAEKEKGGVMVGEAAVDLDEDRDLDGASLPMEENGIDAEKVNGDDEEGDEDIKLESDNETTFTAQEHILPA